MKPNLGWVVAILVSGACSSKEPKAEPPSGSAKPAEPAAPPAAPAAAPAAPQAPPAAPDDDTDPAMERAAEQRIMAELEANTKQVLEALATGKAATLEELAPAGTKISVVSSNAQSSESSTSTKAFTGGAELVKYWSELNVTAMTVKACDGMCCKLEPSYDDDRSLGAQVREVCFAGGMLSKLTIVIDG
ncbi:MAG: hypothetical protein SFX73_26195 [Kofleriaceae bacterium]|nr:hypothetical protein [Kofleriaceae bacterium]